MARKEKYALLLKLVDDTGEVRWYRQYSDYGELESRTKEEIEELLNEDTIEGELTFGALDNIFELMDGDGLVEEDIKDWQIYLLTPEATLLPLEYRVTTKKVVTNTVVIKLK